MEDSDRGEVVDEVVDLDEDDDDDGERQRQEEARRKLAELNVSGGDGTDGKKPIVLIVIGMAGSGKTTLMQRLVAEIHVMGKRPYVLNLDPAVSALPYGCNIDIRDTVNYKNVMKEYHLGPNGGILTSLNLFATKIDEVVSLVEHRANEVDYVLIDTPGQIEIFTWSASGAIVTEAFASTFPTTVLYVVDTSRSTNPVTFMSNMLYACSILYKTQLPFILTFNKTDIVKHQFALEWMQDFEAFEAAVESDSSYTSSLSKSLCLVLDEFYKNLRAVGVSAVTGAGMEEFFKAAQDSAVEYLTGYRVELEKKKAEKARREEKRRKMNMDKLARDIEESKQGKEVLNLKNPADEPEEEEEEEQTYDEDYDEDEDEEV